MSETFEKQARGYSKFKAPYNSKRLQKLCQCSELLSIFCPELQKLLKPIYELTRKGRPFDWGEEQQKAFEEIKNRLQKPPLLSMPDRRDRFLLHSDTSKLATGSALYQVQDGKPKFIVYVSKRMPEAAKNYSITEVEMCGLAINIISFAHLLKRVDFDIVVDHLAIMHIMRSKMELDTHRIKRLLEILSLYSFNLYYIKGKDMILSDILSRQLGDDSDPHKIIPISFNIKEILKENYQKNIVKGTYMVETRSQTKAKAANVPAVQSTSRKPVAQSILPRIDKIPIKTNKDPKPNINTQTQLQDKILYIIKRKVLKGTQVPLTIKEIQAGYLTSPFFKALYRYLAQNILPHKRHARHKVETLSNSFILLDSLLFKLVTILDKEKALLVIPEICAEKL